MSEMAHISLKSQMLTYQKAGKDVRFDHFSELMSRKNLNPKVLFKVIDSVVSGPFTFSPGPDVELSKKILTHFVKNKVEDVRFQIKHDPCILFLILMSILPLFCPVSIRQCSRVQSPIWTRLRAS